MKGRPLSAMQHARSMLPTYLMGTSFRAALTTSLVPEYSAGSPTPTFTRATTATVFAYGPSDNAGASLSLITCASGEARFAGARRISQGVWSPTFADGTPIPSSTLLGYLTEGARTNICLQSNAFTTTWTNSSAAPTQNVTGPDGVANSAWTLTDSSGAVAANISQAITLTAAPYAFSVFVQKTSGATTFPVLQAITGTVTALCTIDTNNGTATVWTAYTGDTMLSGASATCVSVNSTWWRVSLIFTATAASYTHYIYPAATSNATQSTGTIDVTQQGSCAIYGAQVELGSFASTYIATTTSSVSRNADFLFYSSTSNIGTVAVSAYAEIASIGQNIIISASAGAVYGHGNGWLLRKVNSASCAFGGDGSASPSAGELNGNVNKVAGAGNTIGTTQTACVNGYPALTNSTWDWTGAGTTTLNIGNLQSTSEQQHFSGTIRNVRIYTRAMSAGELTALTT